MEERIREITKKYVYVDPVHIWACPYVPESSIPKLTKEIASLYRKFNHWKDNEITMRRIGYSYDGRVYVLKGTFYTHDKLFEHWYNNIKNK